MCNKWELVIDTFPNAYKELFYETFNEEFKECKQCKVTYPKHRIFFRPVKYKDEIKFYTCRNCMENKKIENYIENGLKLHALNIFFKEYLQNKKYCKQCDKFYENIIDNFTCYNSCLCRKCEGVERLESNYYDNVKLKDEGLKKCKYCSKTKSIEDFPFHNKKKETRTAYCCNCELIYKKEKSEYDRKYLEENKETKREYYFQWKENGGKELRQINELGRRSKKAELLSDLTHQQWLDTLDYFNHSCAYCGVSEEEHLCLHGKSLHQEHIIAMSQDGVFSNFNIIPSCTSCNSKKHNRDLEDYFGREDNFTLDSYIKIIDYFLQVT